MNLPARLRLPLLFLLLATTTAVVLGWLSHTTNAVRTEARERFFEQYNRQQLLTAQLAARSIEDLFETFRHDLGLVVSLFDSGEVTLKRAEEVQPTLSRLSQNLAATPVIDLAVFDKEGTVVAISPPDPYTLGRNYQWRDYYRWARDQGQPEQMYLSAFMRLEGGLHRGDQALMVAEGIYGEDGSFLGVTTLALNFDELARRYIHSVRIGENGYAWLADLDEQSVLVDPSGRIAGRSFDEAFLPRWPRLYELLLSTTDGEPGTGWYEFEDPTDPDRSVRKLAAYWPVHIQGRLWTLGVATPQREVEALLSSFLRRQENFSGTLGMAILLGTALLFGLLITWNRLLSHRVALGTRDLAEARSRLESTFAELLASKKLAAVGRMALGLTHEIRNPLSAIRMNVQMIRKKVQPEGTVEQSFAVVEGEILRLNKLLNSVMDFARPAPLRLESTELGAVIERVLQLLSQRLEQERIQVVRQIENPLEARCDSQQIQQVMLNLILNAVEAMASSLEPRILTVTGSKQGDMVSIRVADTGTGIRAEDRDKLFDLFFTTNARGGGLGLPIAQSIALRHAGSLDVDDSVGTGSAFTLRLPLAGPEGETR